MDGRVIKIDRVAALGDKAKEPTLTSMGSVLGNPAMGNTRHHQENAVYVGTLDEAAELIAKGFSLRMGATGKRPLLITPRSLRITRA